MVTKSTFNAPQSHPVFLAQAVVPTPQTVTPQLPPSNPRPPEQAEEFKAALYHSDFAEATRVDGKYHFSPDEKLVLYREAFQHFFQDNEYEKAAHVADFAHHAGVDMKKEYQDVAQAWYRKQLLSSPDSGLARFNPNAVQLINGRNLDHERAMETCYAVYRETMLGGNLNKGGAVASSCGLLTELRNAVCPEAHHNAMIAGHLELGAQIARYCEWDSNVEKSAAEGEIDAIAESNLDVALQIAESFKLYFKIDALKKRKAAKEAERIAQETQRADQKRLEVKRIEDEQKKPVLLQQARVLLPEKPKEALAVINGIVLSSEERNRWIGDILCALVYQGETDEAATLAVSDYADHSGVFPDCKEIFKGWKQIGRQRYKDYLLQWPETQGPPRVLEEVANANRLTGPVRKRVAEEMLASFFSGTLFYVYETSRENYRLYTSAAVMLQIVEFHHLDATTITKVAEKLTHELLQSATFLEAEEVAKKYKLKGAAIREIKNVKRYIDLLSMDKYAAALQYAKQAGLDNRIATNCAKRMFDIEMQLEQYKSALALAQTIPLEKDDIRTAEYRLYWQQDAKQRASARKEKARQEELARVAADRAKARQAAIQHRQEVASARAEEIQRKKDEREEAQRKAREADATARDEFITCLVRNKFEEARRLSREYHWSQKSLASLVNRALKGSTTAIRDSCDNANLIRKEYQWLEGLCTPQRTSVTDKLDGACKLECN